MRKTERDHAYLITIFDPFHHYLQTMDQVFVHILDTSVCPVLPSFRSLENTSLFRRYPYFIVYSFSHSMLAVEQLVLHTKFTTQFYSFNHTFIVIPFVVMFSFPLKLGEEDPVFQVSTSARLTLSRVRSLTWP